MTAVGEGVQLVDAGVEATSDGETVRLGPGDVPEMLDLAARTRPGPFLPRTEELGVYLGIRRGGALAASMTAAPAMLWYTFRVTRGMANGAAGSRW